MIFKPYLKMLDIYYGARCNLFCNQCDTRSDTIRDTTNDPDLETIFEGIRLAREKFEIELYSMIGGEPLYYLDKIDAILSYIRSLDPDTPIQFSTNGTLLSKRINEVSELLRKHKCSLFVCNHFSSFDASMSEKISNSVDELVNQLGLKPGDANKFLYDFMKLDNPRNDPFFAKWIDINKDYSQGEQPNDLYYHDNEIFVHFRPQGEFKKNHYMKDGKPKPFQTGLPHLSYKQGCSSPMCSFLIDKKIYKCAALGTLKRLLEFHNSLDDPDWKKYLDYNYLDLENCTDGDVMKFHLSKFCAIAECDMCGTKYFNRSKEDVTNVQVIRMDL